MKKTPPTIKSANLIKSHLLKRSGIQFSKKIDLTTLICSQIVIYLKLIDYFLK